MPVPPTDRLSGSHWHCAAPHVALAHSLPRCQWRTRAPRWHPQALPQCTQIRMATGSDSPATPSALPEPGCALFSRHSPSRTPLFVASEAGLGRPPQVRQSVRPLCHPYLPSWLRPRPEPWRSTRGFSRILKDSQGFSRILKDSQGFSRILKDSQPFQLERRKRATNSPTMVATVGKSQARKIKAPKVSKAKGAPKSKGKHGAHLRLHDCVPSTRARVNMGATGTFAGHFQAATRGCN